MGAYVLRFKVKGVNVDIYRNGKTYGNEFFKKTSEYWEGNIKVGKDFVSVIPIVIVETSKDILYYARSKNDEFEDGEIDSKEYDRVHEWYDYHSKEIETLENASYAYLTDEEMEMEFIGNWVRL